MVNGFRCIQLDSSGVNSRHKPQLLLCYRNTFIPLALELLFFCGFRRIKQKEWEVRKQNYFKTDFVFIHI